MAVQSTATAKKNVPVPPPASAEKAQPVAGKKRGRPPGSQGPRGPFLSWDEARLKRLVQLIHKEGKGNLPAIVTALKADPLFKELANLITEAKVGNQIRRLKKMGIKNLDLARKRPVRLTAEFIEELNEIANPDDDDEEDDDEEDDDD